MLKSEFVKKLNGFLFEVLKASKPTPAKRLEMIKSLVGYGADVNAKFNGKSVLSLAVDLNETDLILYLKSQGARYGKNLEKQLVEVICAVVRKKGIKEWKKDCLHPSVLPAAILIKWRTLSPMLFWMHALRRIPVPVWRVRPW